jgi:hypothetical protein
MQVGRFFITLRYNKNRLTKVTERFVVRPPIAQGQSLNKNACITTFRQLTPTCGYLARFLPLVEVAMVDARGDESLAP